MDGIVRETLEEALEQAQRDRASAQQRQAMHQEMADAAQMTYDQADDVVKSLSEALNSWKT